MIVLMNVSYQTYVRAIRNNAYGIATDVEKAVANGKVLSDMTNGEVIKAMFPKCEQKENIHNGYFEMYFDGDFGNPSYMRVREYWWNAPYKRGNKNESTD